LTYSNNCNAVKNTAKIKVIIKLNNASFLSPATIAWWHQVQDAPEVNKTIVFNNGISQALKTSIPLGGQTPPISGAGFKLEWKKAQKKAKKNIISEQMNNIIPYLIPSWTRLVCQPS
jgi:hypothetical protein